MHNTTTTSQNILPLPHIIYHVKTKQKAVSSPSASHTAQLKTKGPTVKQFELKDIH